MANDAHMLVLYSGPIADVCLLTVMIGKRRLPKYNALGAMLGFDLFWTFANTAFGLGNGRASYLVLDLLSVLLQIALIAELLSKVLPADNRLAPRGRRIFLRLAVGGSLLAFFSCLFFSPLQFTGPALFEARLDLFTGFLTCETVIAIMIAAQKVGLGWRSHVLAVGQGLMLWALSYVLVEGLGPYISTTSRFVDKLYYFRSIVYLCTVAYWAVSLWREEPARKPISPEMRKYIVALHDRVHYDLGKVGH